MLHDIFRYTHFIRPVVAVVASSVNGISSIICIMRHDWLTFPRSKSLTKTPGTVENYMPLLATRPCRKIGWLGPRAVRFELLQSGPWCRHFIQMTILILQVRAPIENFLRFGSGSPDFNPRKRKIKDASAWYYFILQTVPPPLWSTLDILLGIAREKVEGAPQYGIFRGEVLDFEVWPVFNLIVLFPQTFA